MAREYDPFKLTPPRMYLLAMLVFIALISFLGLILYRQIWLAFATNPGLNGLILGVLVVGIMLAIMQVVRLLPEVSWVNSFRQGREGEQRRKPVLLAPMEAMLGGQSQVALSTLSAQSLLDSIGNRLDERRDTSRYLISLLVFLGLLGTFWGLLGTIGSIGDTIGSLDPSSGDTGDVLEALKTGLKAPLDGMGTAFSSSLFGLAGSLVLGFLDLQSGQAQNRFYLELENWLSSVTDVNSDFINAAAGGEDVTKAMERIASQVREGGGGARTTAAMASLAEGIQGLVKHMRSEQQLIRDWVETQGQNQEETKKLLQQLNRTMAAKQTRTKTPKDGF
ncbi:MAG: flagellar motor protein MotA [Rhizobiaceae bacterium]